MVSITRSSLGFVAPIALSGCTAPATQEPSGMVIGGILGKVIGSHVGQGTGHAAAAILGTVIGASIGGNVGRSMDDTDRLKTAAVLEGVGTGVPTRWVNPDTRNQYTVVPTRTYDAATGAPCREYTVNAVIGGRLEQVVARPAARLTAAGARRTECQEF